LTHVKTQETILGLVLTLTFSAAGAVAQAQLTPEKKKELRKFDPVDVVPEAREGEPDARENQVERRRAQSGRNAGIAASTAPISAAVDSTVAIPQAAPAANAPPSLRATPSLAPKRGVVLTQSAAPKTQSTEPATTGALAPATAVNRPAHSARLSLPLIFFLLGLILLALVAVTIKLRKDLRKL
jgi:hypothetical protein